MNWTEGLNWNICSEDDIDYAKAEWNLNNLPVVANSILKQIDIDISGIRTFLLVVGVHWNLIYNPFDLKGIWFKRIRPNLDFDLKHFFHTFSGKCGICSNWIIMNMFPKSVQLDLKCVELNLKHVELSLKCAKFDLKCVELYLKCEE